MPDYPLVKINDEVGNKFTILIIEFLLLFDELLVLDLIISYPCCTYHYMLLLY